MPISEILSSRDTYQFFKLSFEIKAILLINRTHDFLIPVTEHLFIFLNQIANIYVEYYD